MFETRFRFFFMVRLVSLAHHESLDFARDSSSSLYECAFLEIKEKSLERCLPSCYNSPAYPLEPVQNVWKLCKTPRLSGHQFVKR